MNFIDDHSRAAIAARALRRASAPAVLDVFREAGATWGFPAALLTDNGCVYTTWHRGGPNVMQTELLAMGINYRHSRPYHPQTCGKVERFHQTVKTLPHQPATSRCTREPQFRINRSWPTTTTSAHTERSAAGRRRPSKLGIRPDRHPGD